MRYLTNPLKNNKMTFNGRSGDLIKSGDNFDAMIVIESSGYKFPSDKAKHLIRLK